MKNLIVKMMLKKVFALFGQTKLIWLALLMVGTTAHAGVTVRYQHTDTLGSVIMETNASGQMIGSRHQYQPFGQGLNGQKTGLGYTGHLEDTDLGLTYMQQRYYDPVVGRFYSNDPVGFTASNPMMFNRYAYANNNPYKYTDPNGENPAIAVSRSFQAGYSVGSKINSGITAALGKPLGVAIYNAVNNESSNDDGNGAENKATESGSKAGGLPKPPTGRGSVPKEDRDPKRNFDPKDRETKRTEQGDKCGNNCGKDIDESNSDGHHIERWADGGKTTPENHAEVCKECHKELHSGGKK